MSATQPEAAGSSTTTFLIDPPPPSGPPRPSLDDGHEALVRVTAELDALSADELLPINLDVARGCAIAIGAAPRLRALRPLVLEELPKFPLEAIDRLEDYALALYYANLVASRPPPPDDIRALHREVCELRRLLLSQAKELAARGYFEPAKVDEFKGGQGYVAVASQLVGLTLLFRANWSQVKNRTTVEREDCERGDRLGRELLMRAGGRLQKSLEQVQTTPALDRRARCYTLLMRAYDRCRKMAHYLRWEAGDVGEIVPSLFGKLAPRRKRTSDPESNTDGSQEGTTHSG